MSSGRWRLRAVALILVEPRGDILVLQETKAKPHIGKHAGMYSIPMETIRDGETHESALHRLFREELTGMPVATASHRIGAYLVVPGVWATLYLARTLRTDLTTITGDDVTSHVWMPPDQALTLWLRRGAAEMIRDFMDGTTGVIRRTTIAPSERRSSFD